MTFRKNLRFLGLMLGACMCLDAFEVFCKGLWHFIGGTRPCRSFQRPRRRAFDRRARWLRKSVHDLRNASNKKLLGLRP